MMIGRKWISLLAILCFALPVLAQNPKRIVSLAPSLTKNLHLLQAENLLVGCTNHCVLQTKIDAEIVASAIQVNYERIVMLQPDLLIATSLTKPKTIETFKKLGIDVVVFSSPRNFHEICEQFVRLGEKIGKKELAKQIVVEAENRIELVKQKVPQETPQRKIFMQIGANPLFAVIPGSFMNDFIRFSGTQNIAADLKVGSISRETVLIRNPDVIVLVLMGLPGSEEKERWKKIKTLGAVKNNRILMIDADKACSPTPISFVETLEELIAKIYRKEKSADL